jgi:DNA-directed RNA polymerase specialized sigma24 family protein
MIHAEPLPLERLPLTEIATACRREIARYRRHETSDTRYCLEIFRRALVHFNGNTSSRPDEAAGELLVQIYSEFIKANINRAALRALAFDDLVQQIWLRFWRAADAGLAFPSLEAALRYLKLTTATTVIEERRRASNEWRSVSLEQRAEASGEQELVSDSADLFSQHTRQRFRDRCGEMLTDPLERRIFWRRYGMGFAPREIATQLAREGALIKGRPPTARAVSDALDRIFKRLEDDPEIQDLLRND